MISKRLEAIQETDLDALVANTVAEGKTLEYKRDLPGNTDGEKKEFLADVSSFANTSGGDVIFGVDETKGAPAAIPGIHFADQDADLRRLDSLLADGLDPRVRYATRVVPRNGNPPVLVLRVERGWIGPHRVVFKGHDKFYARNSAGKYPMDVTELRSAFTLSSTVTEKVRGFRMDRVMKAISGDTPVPMVSGIHTILHSIPLESLVQPIQYDVLRFEREPHRCRPLVVATGWDRRINLDGVVTYSSSNNGCLSYTQLFRNGIVEALESYWNAQEYQGKRVIPYAAFEQDLLNYLKTIFDIQKELGVSSPISVALTLTYTKGLEMAREVFSLEHGYAIKEEHLILPETVVEDFETPPTQVLKPIFDLIWNACGYPSSKNFDRDGNWKSK